MGNLLECAELFYMNIIADVFLMYWLVVHDTVFRKPVEINWLKY